MNALSDASTQASCHAAMQDLVADVVENDSSTERVTFGPVADELIRLQPLNPLRPITIHILPRNAQ